MNLMNGFGGNNGFNNNYAPPYQNQINQLNRYMEQLNNNNMNNNNMNSNNNIQTPNTNMNFIPVENLEKAKEFVVNRGAEAWMRDSFQPYIYYKAVDPVGAITFRILEVNDVTDKVLNNNMSNMIQNQNTTEFVSIDNFNELDKKVNGVAERLNKYEAFIDSLLKQPQPQETKEEKPNKPKSNSTQKAGAK